MKIQPYENQDHSRGTYRKSAVNNTLIPKNSASHSMNVNFDTTIGDVVVRPGTTLVGTAVATNQTPLGLETFAGTTNIIVSVFSGGSTASVYQFAGTAWATTTITSLDNSVNNRFTQLGKIMFRVNGVNAMDSSTDTINWVSGTTNCCIASSDGIPSLIHRSKNRLLASGIANQLGRVYFSSIIDPQASPKITWNMNTISGDFIDINPDDGAGPITAMTETATLTLVFKTNAMYRLDAISKTVDVDNIFNIGAVSQEAVTVCQGVTYFFSGTDIRRTNGDYPEQISRLAIQDFIDAIPQSYWSKVSLFNDDFNVYASIGNVTINTGKNDQTTYNNVVLKFSTRDNTWSAHSYAQQFRFGTQYTNSSGRNTVVSDTLGEVQTLNSGTTDNRTPIFFEMVTQENELGQRSHTKQISDKIVVFTNNGLDSSFYAKENDGEWKPIIMNLNNRVNVGTNVKLEGNFFEFKWSGVSSGTAPTFEGYELSDITDIGIIANTNGTK